MAKQNYLYPLVFKPGIKRDGTTFQADYCTSGQWVRFQRGMIRKMGGMKSVNTPNIININRVSNVTILPSIGNDTNLDIYVAGTNEIWRFQITQNFEPGNVYPGVRDHRVYVQNNLNTIIWQSEIIIQGNAKYVVFLGSPNLENINNNDATVLLVGRMSAVNNVNQLDLAPLDNPPTLAGLSGLLFTANYLFVYGSNGLVQWSKIETPLDFSNPVAPDTSKRSISISNDKVIYGRAIRGGVNTPTILFWTLSSVIRCINTGSESGKLQFQIDVLSKTSSILSSRCVVEYDGMFFWPGTNRFFIFNGIVNELSNTMNLNYFFNNLDMAHRQQVFGVKNTQYGEIWWFYPTKGRAAGNTTNNRAIIYNVRENAWYDTAIPRDAGVYSDEYGFMATYGESLTTPNDNTKISLYRHEYETYDTSAHGIKEWTPDDNDYDTTTIASSFTTPTISWAAFNPMKQLVGVDRWLYLEHIEPDFTMPRVLISDMRVIINTKQYAQNANIQFGPYTIPVPSADPAGEPLNGKVDIGIQGRNISFTFNTGREFEMGHVMLSLGVGDGK